MSSYIAIIGIFTSAYFLWRIAEQMPDLIFRVSEIQRDLADMRRAQDQD